MSGKRYKEEFKLEAIKQVTERGYKIADVAKRLGVTQKSLHDWIQKYGDIVFQHQTISSQEEMRKLKTELRRVTEERDILKEAAAFFASGSKKIRIHKIPTHATLCSGHVSYSGASSERILCFA